jgi:hypothetical protein
MILLFFKVSNNVNQKKNVNYKRVFFGKKMQNSQSTTTIVHHVIANVHCVVANCWCSLCCFPPMWLVLPLPLHCPIGWSFGGGKRLIVARLLQKLLHFKYVCFFPKLVGFFPPFILKIMCR